MSTEDVDFSEDISEETTGKDSWNKLPEENSRNFTYFAHFRDQGHKRRKIETSRAFKIDPATVTRISQKYNWDARIEAYEKYIDDMRQEKLAAAREIIDTNFLSAQVTLSEKLSRELANAKPESMREVMLMMRELREGMGFTAPKEDKKEDEKVDASDIAAIDDLLGED